MFKIGLVALLASMLFVPLFADVSADMTEDELKISRSTPSGHLKPVA